MKLMFNESSMDDYRKFMQLKSLPSYSWRGEYAVVPNEYAHMLGVDTSVAANVDYATSPHCFDYQTDISRMAIEKKKFAVFADCGLGKTVILLEFARHAASFGKVLVVCPLMVVQQTIEEAERFYPGMSIGRVSAADLPYWLNSHDPLDSRIGITNYEAIREGLPQGMLSGLILDESSMLKSHYGKWGQRLIELGSGVGYKLALTGTPAPNDRIEYANHAVFLDQFRTVNEFLARYFINKGQTSERWVLRPHAVEPFYRSLSHWSIFLSDPSVYGWQDNTDSIPPIHTHIEHVELSRSQKKMVQELTGGLFVKDLGGITSRAKLKQIARAEDSPKFEYIHKRVLSWTPSESTIIWCEYNDEQGRVAKLFGELAVSIDGSTKEATRQQYIAAFKSRDVPVLISKASILGFGLNLQVATRQVFSGVNDSYEEFYQAVKRSNRIGSTRPLNVHIPVTEVEEPMIQNVLRKAGNVESDTRVQEELFRKYSWSI